MKNKIVLALIAIALIIYLCMGYFFQYSVYYAQHMKHKPNACPEIVMMADNYKYLPSRLKEIYYKDPSGANMIHHKNRTNGLAENHDNMYYFSDKNFRYLYNTKGQVIGCYSRENPDGIKLTDKVFKHANAEVATYLTEYNQELSKPLINLQSLFNYLYENRFN